MAHGEIACTTANYLYKKLGGDPAKNNLSIQNFEYHEPLVARKKTDQKQLLHTEAVLRANSNTVSFRWYNVDADQWYAYASVVFENSDGWMADWSRSNHLVTSRINYLQEAAETGRASRLSQQLAYRLFANLVDWYEVYKGMQTVCLDGMEAYSEVQLSTEGTGEWYIPPWHLESLVDLSGFILNGSDFMDTKNNFFVTPGYKSMRLAKPLKPGGHYQTYVNMMPTDSPNVYAGDVYILEAGSIIGVMEKSMYRSWPRIMLNRFFVPHDKKAPGSKSKSGNQSAQKKAPITNGTVAHSTNGVVSAPNDHEHRDASMKTMTNGAPTPPASDVSTPITNGYHHESVKGNGIPADQSFETNGNANSAPMKKQNELVTRALFIIADEAAMEVEELVEEALFIDLGVDSLMSLVLAQRFRSDLEVEVRDSLFVEFSSIGDLCRWLETC